jgi:hypothetical protein
VRDGGAVFIAQVKGNQTGLLKAVQSVCEAAPVADRIQTKDRRRGRQEIRTVEIFPLSQDVIDPDWRELVTIAIRVRRERMDRSSRSGMWTARADEAAFYVSSAQVTAAVAAAAIRGHWGIENRAHHVRDVTMAEDASRVRKNPGVLARIRSFAANILRFNGAENIRDARYRLAVGGVDPLLKCRVM